MTFKEELESLTVNYNSPKLEDVKQKLKQTASNGERTITFDSKFYDKHVINWLVSQGLDVKETSDQREGDFIRVSW
jgi:hypothetical protein